jgi:hypothetical protein
MMGFHLFIWLPAPAASFLLHACSERLSQRKAPHAVLLPMALLRLDQGLPAGHRAPCPVDVIAIHGLNGDREQSWTHKPSGTLWLRDLLPHDLPGARIYSYGYDARFFTNNFMTINDFARDLLSVVSRERDSEEVRISPPLARPAFTNGPVVILAIVSDHRASYQTRKRLIYLVVHSMGGIVAKKVNIVQVTAASGGQLQASFRWLKLKPCLRLSLLPTKSRDMRTFSSVVLACCSSARRIRAP